MKQLITLITLLLLGAKAWTQIQIRVFTDPSLNRTYTGKLYIFTQSDTTKRIPNNPDPSQAMFAWMVKDVKDEITVTTDQASNRYLPNGMSTLKPGYYKIAGILDTDFEERGTFNAGNIYARKEAILYVDEQGKGTATIAFTSFIASRIIRETEQIKEVVLKSKLLSDFRKKDIFMKAAVRLPASYKNDSTRLYPIVFVIPGWGGTHYDMQGSMPVRRYGMDMGKDKIYVYLNPETQSPFGLHAFVDSRVNGPWGKALVEELIPHLENKYRIVKDASQRFVMGQSTGGYGSLWLQLNYPDAFGGCWSVSPDPVDFTSFIGINLYEKDVNLYTNKEGKERGIFFMQGKPTMTTRVMAAVENFTGDGEQLQAFEAEFGVPDKKGRPQQVYDHTTGKVDPAVVKSWEPYDLGKFIQRNASKLSGKIHGKVHVYAGAADNFLLNEAVTAFTQKAVAAKVPVVTELIPGADHWNIWSEAFTKRVVAEIDARIK
jgi:S-formylglutathione hydrolase FrmB